MASTEIKKTKDQIKAIIESYDNPKAFFNYLVDRTGTDAMPNEDVRYLLEVITDDSFIVGIKDIISKMLTDEFGEINVKFTKKIKSFNNLPELKLNFTTDHEYWMGQRRLKGYVTLAIMPSYFDKDCVGYPTFFFQLNTMKDQYGQYRTFKAFEESFMKQLKNVPKK